jgi:glutamate formiminotransferase / 5-formyltetrahydrofolate cyclo-ligase
MAIFEIVPNLSEGRDASTIDRAVTAAERCGAKVLHRTSDPVHHRSVITIAGERGPACDAAVAIAGIALERIDLRRHTGVHPRMGALDVLPFVPLGAATMAQAVEVAHEAGRRIWSRYKIPSFYYGEAALSPQRRSLPDVRPNPIGPPDVGTLPFHPSAGAIAIGARGPLVAFNIELDTDDLRVARAIARRIRARDGGLRTVRAMAFPLRKGAVQVSLNVTDERATPLYRVFEVVRSLAADRGVSIVRGELIGCIPRSAVTSAALYALGVEESAP